MRASFHLVTRPQIDVGDEFSRQAQVIHPVEVVGDLHGAQRRGNKDGLRGHLLEFCGGQGYVHAREVDLAGTKAFNPPVGTDSGIRYGDVVLFPVAFERFGVERKREGRSRGGDDCTSGGCRGCRVAGIGFGVGGRRGEKRRAQKHGGE